MHGSVQFDLKRRCFFIEEREVINKYFELSERIQQLEKEIGEYQRAFYDQTFSTQVQYTELGLNVVAFKVDHGVCDHAMVGGKKQSRLNALRFKQKHFKEYLDSLSSEEIEYLVQCYLEESTATEQQAITVAVLDEISEIEEASHHRYKTTRAYVKPPPAASELTDEHMLELLEG